MIQPNDLLANGRVLTAVLSELAPPDVVLDEAAKLAVLDRILGALLLVPDEVMRGMLLVTTTNHLQMSKRLVSSRFATAMTSYRQRLIAEEARAAAKAPKAPPIDQFNAALAAAVPVFRFLLLHVAAHPDLLDESGKLKALDELIAAVLPMPDTQLRDLYLEEAAKHLELKPKMVRDRLRSAQSAPSSPAGQGLVGGEERDGGFHRELMAALRRFLATKGLTPDATNGWLDGSGSSVGVKLRELVNEFYLNHASFYESLPRDRIDITLTAMTQAARAARRQAILATLTGKPSTDAGRAALRAWLVATTHRDDPVDFAVMKHWLWQVKRLNTGKPVSWDLMPILQGKQGDGKSTAIQRLCDPWKELVVGIKAETLTDERSTEVLGDHAIGFWAEMAGGSRAEVQRLKNTMTSRDLSYRELGGHHHNRVVRRMAFIGDSNNYVREVITDPTGARRFYEIRLNGWTDREAINALDATLIWQAVSEDEPCPYDAVADDVRERQRDLVTQDTFNHFIDWCDGQGWPRLVVTIQGQPYFQDGAPPTIEIPKYDPAMGYTLTELAVLLKHYIGIAGGIQRGDSWLVKRLGEAGWQKHRPRRGVSTTRTPRWLKPTDPVPAEDAASPLPAGQLSEDEKAARAAKATAQPSTAEDLFQRQEPPMREPGADEEEDAYHTQQEPDDGALDL